MLDSFISILISIHAPARGGDVDVQPFPPTLGISIHAPARGGDRPRRPCASCPCDFNPRPREGGRPNDRAALLALINISIHAPARGGDRGHDFDYLKSPYFNPRPREGGRHIVAR